MLFEGKNAVITGGAGAIGSTITRHFFRNGFEKIALLDINQDESVLMNLQKSFPHKTITFHLTDVTNKSDLECSFNEVMRDFKSIDCVITCAAILDEKNYKRTLDVNLFGVIETNYVAMQHMAIDRGHNGGLIVNVSSLAGVDCSHYSMPVYTATKHGVVAFTRSMGVDYFHRKTGIKFVTVCPGQTFTPFLCNLSEKVFSPEVFEVNKMEIKHVLKQTVDEFAEAFIDVLKENKNGSVWIIDGGERIEFTCSRPWYDIAVQSTLID